jgi:hypothetical protein
MLGLDLTSAATRRPRVPASTSVPYPAPAGFRWAFVTDGGAPVFDDGGRLVVDLVEL